MPKSYPVALVVVCIFAQTCMVDWVHSTQKKTGFLLYMPAIIGNVGLVCPRELTRFVLVPDHTWTWSPGGQVGAGLVQGSTTGGSCDILVSGDVASGEDCLISYSNSGTVGNCQLNGQSTALLSFEGTCTSGKIVLTITEIQNPEAELGGILVCPVISEPYPTFYPPSITNASFLINSEGSTAAEAKSDPAGFTYSKKWTLMPAYAIP